MQDQEPALPALRAPDGANRFDLFFDALARCGNVVEAESAAGLAPGELARLRATRCDFAKRWQAALAASYDALELEMLERARFGNRDPKRYNDALSLRLLLQHRARCGSDPPGDVARPRLDEIVGRLRAAVEAREAERKALEGGSDEGDPPPG